MAKEFKPTAGAKGPKAEAKIWIKEYDDKKRKDKKKDTKSVFFGKDFINSIFSENPEASGISFYFATKYSAEAGKDIDTLVLLPTKMDGTIMWSTDPTLTETEEYGWNDGDRCPSNCPIGDAP
jgi:hypothetical protein